MANHPIVHVEIPAKNLQAAGDFYSQVFGWKVEVDAVYNYAMFSAEGGPGGGFVSTEAAHDGGMMQYKVDSLLVYLGSDDIDADLARIEAHGGKTVLPKTEIPQVGWFAIFTDPTGNHMALYTGTGQ
jgi:predicted enzyme related to lactoylglutathione lyase